MISEIRIPAKHYLATLCLRFLLKNMDNKTSLEWLLRGLNVLVHIKCSELCQVAGKHLAIIIVAIIIALLAVIKKKEPRNILHTFMTFCLPLLPTFLCRQQNYRQFLAVPVIYVKPNLFLSIYLVNKRFCSLILSYQSSTDVFIK